MTQTYDWGGTAIIDSSARSARPPVLGVSTERSDLIAAWSFHIDVRPPGRRCPTCVESTRKGRTMMHDNEVIGGVDNHRDPQER
jgi:hypothetical protein